MSNLGKLYFYWFLFYNLYNYYQQLHKYYINVNIISNFYLHLHSIHLHIHNQVLVFYLVKIHK